VAVSTHARQVKDTDSFLLRVPTALREMAAEQASSQHMSQNAFITNSLLFGVLVYGERKYIGSPENLLALVAEIDRALKEDDAAMNAFNTRDWQELEAIVGILKTCEIITTLKVRPDTKAGKETTVFSFVLTKNGKSAWPGVRQALIMIAQKTAGQELLLMA
jgi:hypothetical protein